MARTSNHRLRKQQHNSNDKKTNNEEINSRLKTYPPFGNKRHLGNAKVTAKFPGNKDIITIPTVPCNIHTILPDKNHNHKNVTINLPTPLQDHDDSVDSPKSPRSESSPRKSSKSLPVHEEKKKRNQNSRSTTCGSAPIVDSNMSLYRKNYHHHSPSPIIHQPLTPPPNSQFQPMPMMFYPPPPPAPVPPPPPSYFPPPPPQMMSNYFNPNYPPFY